MKLFRIARSEHVDDLSGMGARLYGGRWNEKGVSVVYTSGSLPLAALELIVHLPPFLLPPLWLCEIELPENVSIHEIKESSLPTDWKHKPPSVSTRLIGSDWARARTSLLLVVPSVIIPREKNILINPQHKEFRKIKTKTEKFLLDERLIERKVKRIPL